MFNWNIKESPILSLFGMGGGAGSNLIGGTSVVQATGGTISTPGNGYAYHYFDGVADVYTSNVNNDTIFANYSLETRSVGQQGNASPVAKSYCLVLKSAQETVDVRSQNTGGSTSSTYSFWYSTDNGTSFSPHPQTHTGSMDGSTAVTIGPHADGVTHVVYSRGANGNRYYWAPTPVATFVPNGAKTIDIVMTGGGGGGGGTSGGGAGGLVHYANKAVTTGTITFAIGVGGLHGPGAAPGADQVGADSTLSGPDFPATITAKGGGGGGAFNVSDLPSANRSGGSGGGGYSDAGGSNQGPGGSSTQGPQNSTYTPLPDFNQYGNAGGKGSTKIGYIAGGGGGGAGGVGVNLPGPDRPNAEYQAANAVPGGPGQAISGFEYALWGRPDLEPLSPSNNHFAGGGGGRPSPSATESAGGTGGGGGSAGPTDILNHGIPILGGGAGGGAKNGGGGSGGVVIRYAI